MLRDDIIDAINQSGFDEYCEINSSEIIFAQELLAQCSSNTCGHYGKNYTCPPFSGDIDENKARILKYQNAILLNKLVQFDFKSRETWEKSSSNSQIAIKQLMKLTKDLPVMILKPGGCDICEKCTVQINEPCRFPDKKRYSVEGSGINISLMAKRNKLTYNAGGGKLGFFFIVLY